MKPVGIRWKCLSLEVRGLEYLSKHKTKFVTLVVIEIILITLHMALTEPKVGVDVANTWSVVNEWHFWAGLLFGYYIIYYMFTLACPSCGYKQIWRSNNCMDWRLPDDKCWHCRHDIDQK